MLEPRALLAVMIGQEAATGFNPPDNLIANGSFEQPVLTRGWNTFVGNEISNWTIIRTVEIMAEVQRNGLNSWVASEGTQWIELDGDETGPGVGWNKKAKGRAELGLYTIQQGVSGLTPGHAYSLSFDFATSSAWFLGKRPRCLSKRFGRAARPAISP